MDYILQQIKSIVWGVPTILLILGMGIFLSIGTGFCQITFLPRAIRHLFIKPSRKDTIEGVTPFQALCTALAATVGTGNIAGVAGAIALGGPGAVFWMWISGLLGMGVKYAEATLSVHYSKHMADGKVLSGPMYMMDSMGGVWKKLAYLYAFFGIFAAFGVGNGTQINAVIGSFHSVFAMMGKVSTRIQDLGLGLIMAVLLGAVLLGGVRRIGNTAEKLIPAAAGIYILLCLCVVIRRRDAMPGVFKMMIRGAFDPCAVTGGCISGMLIALRTGISRGIFTNEAGMGTAAIAHGRAEVKHPCDQGLMGILEVFIDTLLICTLTALAILCSGVKIPYGEDPGAMLTSDAFSSILGPWAGIILAVCLSLFAFATVLGWGLYGGACAEYIFGSKAVRQFTFLQIVILVISSVLNTSTVWTLSEIINGLMAIPNLLCLAALSPVLLRLTKEYKSTR